jgi:flagellar motor switch protein FliN
MAPRTNDPASFGGGELNQELIDQMLNGSAADQSGELWDDAPLGVDVDPRSAAGSASDGVGQISSIERPAPSPMPPPTAVHPVQFMPLTQDLPGPDQPHGIELLMDVALEVSVELGRSHMSIGEILSLRTGSVIELDKLAGEPVDVSVNGTLIARGEVVVVDEKFGVRITEVVSRARRMASVG